MRQIVTLQTFKKILDTDKKRFFGHGYGGRQKGKNSLLLSSHCSMQTLLSVFPPHLCPNFLKSEQLLLLLDKEEVGEIGAIGCRRGQVG